MVAENQPGHIDQIKQTNAGAVYRLIDQLGPVSRIDLSRLAQLAPASITKIVREMLEAHLVQELEIKEAGNRGRPAVGLVVETEAWHYLSLRISRGEIFLALRDLSSKLVVEESQELALKDDSPLLDRIISHIDQFFIRHQKKLERLTSIAITLPGIIDTILFPVISDSIRQQALPAYSQHISVESTQFSNQGTMAGAALVKDAMYNGSLLIRLLQG
ncbi:ROK family transcriptional regulator [Escherichia coli]|nr:ROK family transcriptional regulator [Escherichia coli]